jgi:hypothetical protein
MRDNGIGQMSGEAPAWQPQSPFYDGSVRAPSAEPPAKIASFTNESPFVNEIDDRFAPPDPAARAVAQMLSELNDQEFDVAVYEVVHELAGIAGSRVETEVGDVRSAEAHVERMLEERLAPIARAYQEQLDELSQQLVPLDVGSLSETELETLIERTPAPTTMAGPVFEFFLKKLWDKAKKVVKGAVKVVKKAALGPLFAGLKKLIRPLLRKVLTMAMGKIPEKYRPLAEKLAEKFGVKKKALPSSTSAPSAASAPSADAGAPAGASAADTPSDGAAPAAASPDASAAGATPPAEPATAEIAEVQSELDEGIAEMLLAKDEVELEIAVATQGAERPAIDPQGELERGRARFVHGLRNLREGEDPTPVMENFVPVIFMAVKLGLKLIGRKNVIKFVGGLLGKLISPLVGDLGPPLGLAIADIGLKLLGFEMPVAEQGEAGAHAIAHAVEGTVRRVAAAPAYVHDNEALLESYTREAFDAEVAACLPPGMIRAELREAPGVDGMWVPMPRRGRSYYKKFSRTFEVEITHAVAATIRTFHGGTLDAFLRDALQVKFPVHARAHIFEAMTGCRLAHIAEHDHARGLGHANAYRRIHPLNNHAALVLLQHPKLGRPFDGPPDPLRVMVGQRYYFLEIEQAPAYAPETAHELGQASHFRAHVDLPRDEMRVRIHVGEPVAQSIATELRRTRRGAALVHRLRLLFTSATAELASAQNDAVLRISIDPPGPDDRASLATVARHGQHGAIRRELGAKIVEWTWIRLVEFANQKADDFVRASEEPQNGVTIVLTFRNPPRMAALRKLLRGGSPSADDRWPSRETPAASIRVFAGGKAD